VALSIETPHGVVLRIHPRSFRGYAASRPMVFGLSSSPGCPGEAILRPSKTAVNLAPNILCDKPALNGGRGRGGGGSQALHKAEGFDEDHRRRLAGMNFVEKLRRLAMAPTPVCGDIAW
jgi:hypothetical protein